MAEKSRYVVTNASKGARIVFHGGSGTHVPAGSSTTIEMTAAEADNAVAESVAVTPEGKSKPAKPEEIGELKAVHRGGGSYSIMRGDQPVEAVESLSKEDAHAFNEMSDADKAEFIAGHAKPAE